MTTTPRQRETPPLVYSRRQALEDARELLPDGRCVETVVEKAILAGECYLTPTAGVAWGETWRATLCRRPSRLGLRFAWVVTDIQEEEISAREALPQRAAPGGTQ